ncbi:hypothetical protein [Nocardiopsis sp. FIRDI 009]|uniref:hypothetical protein n=1 Tax=Nocardiopsis sp. FIRDI 009 TaxID=714197 RepID=UPI000E2715B9|nr:hypothetical protein [Nocardiopsis sp. FIRDI 009]
MIWVVASLLLQEGGKGFLNGRFTTDDSLLFSATAFALTTVLFTAVRLARGPVRPVTGPQARTVGLLAAMNVLTAVCFLGVYVSLAWVPSTLVSGWVAAVGPLAVAVAGLCGLGARPTVGTWLLALGLLATVLLLALRLGGFGDAGTDAVVWALPFTTAAGASASGLALVSRRLATAGVHSTTVMAHRFHLTYTVAFAALAVRGVGFDRWLDQFPGVLVLSVVAVALPLYLLQIGLQRVEPAQAMAVLATAPAVTYLSQVSFGGGFDPVTLGVIAVLAALVLGTDVHTRRREAAARLPSRSLRRGPRTRAARATPRERAPGRSAVGTACGRRRRRARRPT